VISDPLARADFSHIPFHLHNSLRRYIGEGRIPGHFLVGCLANDLQMAFYFAPAGVDITEVLRFIRRYCPKLSYGAPERLARWEEMGGWNGMAQYFEYGERVAMERRV
jgi:hypothetical protein